MPGVVDAVQYGPTDLANVITLSNGVTTTLDTSSVVVLNGLSTTGPGGEAILGYATTAGSEPRCQRGPLDNQINLD